MKSRRSRKNKILCGIIGTLMSLFLLPLLVWVLNHYIVWLFGGGPYYAGVGVFVAFSVTLGVAITALSIID